MTFDEARREIRSRFRDVYPRDRKGGVVCPLCGSGSGPDGSGISENPHKPGHLRCWSCGFSGDVFDLVQADPKLSCGDYPSALSYLAGELGFSIDGVRSARQAAKPSRARSERTGGDSREAEKDFAEYYRECGARLDDPGATEFLKRRGVSLETAREAGLGYDPAWRSPTAIAEGKNPPASPRLIIPCSRAQYIARDARPDADGRFAKMNEGRTRLFGAAALDRDEPVFVTEGFFDALAVMEAGGAALSLNSAGNRRLLLEELDARGGTAPPLILALDADEAGEKGTRELARELKSRKIVFSTGDVCGRHKDPNEALCADRDGFRAAVKAAIAEAKEMGSRREEGETSDEVAEAFYAVLPDGADMATFDDPENRDELIPTGIACLDELFDGGLASGLYALGARTACGKTTLLLQIANNIAGSGRPVLYVALEMGRRQLQSRSISRYAYEMSCGMSGSRERLEPVVIPAKDICKGRAVLEDYPARADYARAKGYYATRIAPMMHTVTPTLTTRYLGRPTITGEDVRAIAEGMRARDASGRPPAIFIDYLQLLDKLSERMTVREAVDANIMLLKTLSDDLRAPVVMISSMNRGSYGYGSEPKRRLTNESPNDDWVDMFEAGFKESGGIEYTCEHILGMRVTGRDGAWTDVALHHVKCRDDERRGEPVRLSMYGPGSVFLERGEPANAPRKKLEDNDVY